MTERPAESENLETDRGATSLSGSKLGTTQDRYDLPRGNRRLAELVFRLVTEGHKPGEQAMAVGIGVFIGCIPVFGTHIFMVLVVASLTGLSRVRMYAATWISNPFFAPILVWAELQVGHLLLTGRWMTHSVQQISELGAAGIGWTLIVGTMVVGIALGILAASGVWAYIPRGMEVMRRRRAIEAAAHRYLDLGLLSWFQARNTLYGNPDMADLATGGKLIASGKFVDLGCGQGELLALILEAPGTGPPGRYVGITKKAQWAVRARRVLPSEVEIEVADPAASGFGTVDSVVVWKARRRDAPRIDDEFIRKMRHSLNPNGLLVISWSKKGLFDHKTLTYDRVERGLEAQGFSIEHRVSATSWYRRWNLIVARA